MDKLEDYIDIVCITYNRSKYLENTLKQFSIGPFSNCEFYLLDNCSTDNTKEIVNKYQKSNLHYIKNTFNIGGNANIMRAFEYGTKPYVWLIGDDDEYDFSDVDDLLPIIQEKEPNLIHVGAHTDTEWSFGGRLDNCKTLVSEGYHYFKFASFIGCNIVKRSEFKESVIKGYANIINSYPHMPFLLSVYENDDNIYLSRNQIAKAIIGNQGCSSNDYLTWWSETSNLLTSKEDKALCFFDQFRYRGYKQLLNIKSQYSAGHLSYRSYSLIRSFFPFKDQVLCSVLYPIYKIKHYVTAPKAKDYFNKN